MFSQHLIMNAFLLKKIISQKQREIWLSVTWLKIHRQFSKVRGGDDQFRNWEAGKSSLWSHCTPGNSWYSNSYSFLKEKSLSCYLPSQQEAHSMAGLSLGAGLASHALCATQGMSALWVCYKAQSSSELQILQGPRRCCPQCQQWLFGFHKYFHSYHWYKHSQTL